MPINHRCPVCLLPMDSLPEIYSICPCCGTEFGVSDVSSTVGDLRRNWIDGGMQWWSKAPVDGPPDGWDPVKQLQGVDPEDFTDFEARLNVFTKALMDARNALLKEEKTNFEDECVAELSEVRITLEKINVGINVLSVIVAAVGVGLIVGMLFLIGTLQRLTVHVL